MYRIFLLLFITCSILMSETIDGSTIEPLEAPETSEAPVVEDKEETLQVKVIPLQSESSVLIDGKVYTSRSWKKNVIGFGINGFFSGITFNYERHLADNLGLYISEAILLSDVINSGKGVISELQFRIHFTQTSHNPLCSGYIAPFVQHIYRKVSAYTYDSNYNYVDKNEIYHTLKIGGVGGRRWIMKERFSFDLHGGYGFIPIQTVNGEYDNDHPLDNLVNGFHGGLSFGFVF